MLHYTQSGQGKETLILLHGFMENSAMWEDLEPRLSSEFSVIKIDLPGHGQSEVYNEINTMDFMAEKVYEVVEHFDLKDVHLLGHSMGGYTALAFAEKYPEQMKSLCLFFTNTLPDNAEKKDNRKRSIRIIDSNYGTFVNTGVPDLFSSNEKDRLEGKINLAKQIALSTDIDGVKAAQLGMAERPDRTAVLHELAAKILIIAGKHDNAVNTDVFLEAVPDRTNIKTYVLDCGHNGHWEKPSICAEIINTELLHNLPKHLVM